MKKLLSINADAKTIKGQGKGYLTGILYLAPHKESGVMNVCPDATPGCIATCLFTAGRGRFPKVRQARIERTKLFNRGPHLFVDMLVKEITSLCKRAAKKTLIPAIRLNGTSDLPWERITGSDGQTLMQTFPKVQFYDYTKSYQRIHEPNWPSNYHLTFSRSESNTNRAEFVIQPPAWANIAVVFAIKRGQPLPTKWAGYPVLDGDLTDLRFLDPKGHIVGLRAKGKAKKDKTGFVVTEVSSCGQS